MVASGASGANQIDAGYYTGPALCDAISRWLAAELAAARIHGYYTLMTGITSNVGLRTKMYWRVEDASDVNCWFELQMPGEVALFLGIQDESAMSGQSMLWKSDNLLTNENNRQQGDHVPFRTLVFSPTRRSCSG